MIKRYEAGKGDWADFTMEQTDDGGWISYTDHVAALEAVKATVWQTMDSAPQDGTEFLAISCYESGRTSAAVYKWEGPPNYWHARREGVCIRPEYQERFHWVPLPGSAIVLSPALEADRQVIWRPISEADSGIAYIVEAAGIRIGNSYPIWARDSDGRVFECLWADDGKRAYWWDIEGESPVDPVEFMPHPLAALSDKGDAS